MSTSRAAEDLQRSAAGPRRVAAPPVAAEAAVESVLRTGASSRLDAASRTTAAWLRTWDASRRAGRERMLLELIRVYQGQTAPEMERTLGIGASLLFTRLVSWLRLSHGTGANVSTQLRAIGLFVCAPGGERLRAEFVTVGGLQTVVDTVALSALVLPSSAKREALLLLTGIARTSREYKAAQCELRASAVVVAFMKGCADDDAALDAGRELLVALSEGNPQFALTIANDALELLTSRENARAQLFGAEAFREILAQLGSEQLYDEGLGERRTDAEEAVRVAEQAAGLAQGEDILEEADGEEAGAADPARPPASRRRSMRQSIDAARQVVDAEHVAHARALASDCVLGVEHVDAAAALLRAFSLQTQREAVNVFALLCEHDGLHSLLALRLRAALLEPRAMHAQAAAAAIAGARLASAPPGFDGADSPLADDGSALAEHDAKLSERARASRARFADLLVEREAVPLTCLLLLHERSSECRRQAAVSLQAMARFGSPAAAAEVLRYAGPVFEEIVVRRLRAASRPARPAARCSRPAASACNPPLGRPDQPDRDAFGGVDLEGARARPRALHRAAPADRLSSPDCTYMQCFRLNGTRCRPRPASLA
ncbi:hypothetical protein T492DRAFT_269093 [Pavlovales sp. CCMP2436]|nr:hypothetical protein T492DRAFT_269093 [Pavlovales sp. CCMP2436]